MLTPYDELPVHQYAHPFSQLPVSDLNWDDGYYFGIFSAEERVFLYSGLRVAPNADMVGAYAGVSLAGRQLTVRASRTWRPDFSIAVGPLRYEFVEPFEEIRLVLEPNESGLSFDLGWHGLSPAYQEAHHLAFRRGRRTTDQTRYCQSGTASGWIEVEGRRYDVRPHEWYGTRDHSWGLYEPRSPLSDPREWLPPEEQPEGARRMLRFWLPFQSRGFGGFYQFHEDEHGRQGGLNDVFGTPFEGRVDFHDDRPPVRFASGQHRLRFEEGRRLLRGGSIDLEDEHGRTWHQELEVAMPPWLTFPIGYYKGTWRDGGNIHTYHGPADPHVEWDDLDFRDQPATHVDYDGRRYERVYGAEYLVRVHTEGPEGVTDGLGQIEFFMHRNYQRYQPEELLA